MLEVGYPPTRQSSITSHTGEAMLMRDLLGTGIAIYDEKPYMYEVSAQRVFAEIIPARDFFYPAHRHHQGTGYGQYRFQYEMYCAWLLHRMTGNHYFSPEQQFVPYEWVYKRRPDGKMVAEGDVLSGTATRAFMLTAGYYQDPILQGEYLAARDADSIEALDRVLFLDPGIDPRPATELPLTKYFPVPMSSLIARTSWSGNPVIAMLALHEFQFNNHDHLDAGSFTLYYRGPLALDSGVYGTYHSDHDQHYYKRTVAHNAMLVCDPEERFVGGRVVNDCGQRWPNERTEPRNLDILLNSGYRVARLLGRDFGPDAAAPDYSYLEGDLTEAYSKKVSRHQRAFVFWNLKSPATPAALIVFDRLTAARPEFRKTWLLHSMDQPELRDQTAVLRYGGGKLVNFTLLPAAGNFRAELIGGEGKEFWVADRNFVTVNAVTPALEAGAWRLEISPLEPSADDIFLNAMAVLDHGEPEPDPPSLVEAGELVGVLFSGRAAFFSRGGERIAGPVRLHLPEGLSACLLTDLQEGEWEILSWDILARKTVAAEAGTLYIEKPGPSLELRRVAPGVGAGVKSTTR
jgi:heparin/heparan-sulfate lyase